MVVSPNRPILAVREVERLGSDQQRTARLSLVSLQLPLRRRVGEHDGSNGAPRKSESLGSYPRATKWMCRTCFRAPTHLFAAPAPFAARLFDASTSPPAV